MNTATRRAALWGFGLLLRMGWLALSWAAFTAFAQGVVQTAAPFRLRELPKGQRYELRVLYVEDARLPTLTASERQALYGKIEQLTRAWFGYDIRLREVGQKELGAFFAAQEPVFQRHFYDIRAMMIDPEIESDRRKLRTTIATDFRRRELPFIAGYLHAGKLESKAAAEEIAERQFVARLKEIQAIPVAGGGVLVEKAQARRHAYPHWAFLLAEITEADFVLTNTIVAGADTTMPIYVIARGGITTAITNNNPRAPLQAAMMATLYPLLSEAPIFLRERGRIPESERLDVIATFCLHELGHLLLRFDEYYDHPHCVHVAPPGLNYYTWHQSIRSGGPCLLPHRTLERF